MSIKRLVSLTNPLKNLMKIENDEQAYLQALVLAITAPNEEKSLECQKIAASIETRLTEKQIDLCKKGIEVCMELCTTKKGHN